MPPTPPSSWYKATGTAGVLQNLNVESHFKAQEKSEFLHSGLAKDGAKECGKKVICHYLAGRINDKHEGISLNVELLVHVCYEKDFL